MSNCGKLLQSIYSLTRSVFDASCLNCFVVARLLPIPRREKWSGFTGQSILPPVRHRRRSFMPWSLPRSNCGSRPLSSSTTIRPPLINLCNSTRCHHRRHHHCRSNHYNTRKCTMQRIRDNINGNNNLCTAILVGTVVPWCVPFAKRAFARASETRLMALPLCL
jgi:hypothetical protein